MLEFVDPDLYFFFLDKNNFINPCQRQEPDPLKKVPDPAGQKSPDLDPHPWCQQSNMYIEQKKIYLQQTGA